MADTALDRLLDRMRALAEEMRTTAKDRRQLHAVDAVADTSEFWATRVDAAVQALEAESEYLTAEQYGALHGVSAVSVRNWIRAGELQAVRGPDGSYRIPRHAVRVRRALAS